jgi:hypothetical protein
MTPGKLAKLLGRHVSTISIHLAKLRSADIVRLLQVKRCAIAEDKGEIKELVKTLGGVIDASAKLD